MCMRLKSEFDEKKNYKNKNCCNWFVWIFHIIKFYNIWYRGRFIFLLLFLLIQFITFHMKTTSTRKKKKKKRREKKKSISIQLKNVLNEKAGFFSVGIEMGCICNHSLCVIFHSNSINLFWIKIRFYFSPSFLIWNICYICSLHKIPHANGRWYVKSFANLSIVVMRLFSPIIIIIYSNKFKVCNSHGPCPCVKCWECN